MSLPSKKPKKPRKPSLYETIAALESAPSTGNPAPGPDNETAADTAASIVANTIFYS